MWTKIEFRAVGKPRRTRFGVSKTKNGVCFVLLPASSGFQRGDRVEYFSAEGKIGFQRAKSGFAVFLNGKSTTTYRVAMPSETRDFFPTGTTDIEVTRDGDMYVIDLSQFPAQEAAQ